MGGWYLILVRGRGQDRLASGGRRGMACRYGHHDPSFLDPLGLRGVAWRHEMKLGLVRFRREHFAEYSSWFADQELHRQLGPLDGDWLESVLAQQASTGSTWSVFRGSELVAVVETVCDPRKILPAGITAIAVKPCLRRQGIGTLAMETVRSRLQANGMDRHFAFVSSTNPVARKYLESLGFVATDGKPDRHGMIEYRHDTKDTLRLKVENPAPKGEQHGDELESHPRNPQRHDRCL